MDVDVIIHILSNVPEEYEVQVNELEEKLQNASKPLEIEEVRTKLNARYVRIQKNEDTRHEDTALAAFHKQYTELSKDEKDDEVIEGNQSTAHDRKC